MSLPLGKIRFNLSAQGKASIRQAWRTPAAMDRRYLRGAIMDDLSAYGHRMAALQGITMPEHYRVITVAPSGANAGYVAFHGDDALIARFPISACPDQFAVTVVHGLPLVEPSAAPAPKRAAKPAAPVLAPTPDEGFNLAGKVFWHLSRGRMHRTQVAA